jgi:hypothetical protein
MCLGLSVHLLVRAEGGTDCCPAAREHGGGIAGGENKESNPAQSKIFRVLFKMKLEQTY